MCCTTQPTLHCRKSCHHPVRTHLSISPFPTALRACLPLPQHLSPLRAEPVSAGPQKEGIRQQNSGSSSPLQLQPGPPPAVFKRDLDRRAPSQRGLPTPLLPSRDFSSPMDAADLNPTTCWGALTKGHTRGCEAGFVIGKAHFKNKFCARCRERIDMPLHSIRALTPGLREAYTNPLSEGFWKRAPPTHWAVVLSALSTTPSRALARASSFTRTESYPTCHPPFPLHLCLRDGRMVRLCHCASQRAHLFRCSRCGSHRRMRHAIGRSDGGRRRKSDQPGVPPRLQGVMPQLQIVSALKTQAVDSSLSSLGCTSSWHYC